MLLGDSDGCVSCGDSASDTRRYTFRLLIVRDRLRRRLGQLKLRADLVGLRCLLFRSQIFRTLN